MSDAKAADGLRQLADRYFARAWEAERLQVACALGEVADLRYYFHAEYAGKTIPDHAGEVLPSLEAARAHAATVIRDLTRNNGGMPVKIHILWKGLVLD